MGMDETDVPLWNILAIASFFTPCNKSLQTEALSRVSKTEKQPSFIGNGGPRALYFPARA
jgi:hypothetical protein